MGKLPAAVFMGFDKGAPGGDFSVEGEVEIQPDGTIKVLSMRVWQHEIESEATDPAAILALAGETTGGASD